jgi:pantothenate kinase
VNNCDAARLRKRRERARKPEHTAALNRRHKAEQRQRAAGDLFDAMQRVALAWNLRGRRGFPWTRDLRAALAEAGAAVDRYREVK